MKLNLGCGYKKRPGWVNCDKETACFPDKLFDIESRIWPWNDGSVSEIALIHTLEHVGRELEVFIRIMQNMYKVLKPGGRVEIDVPHPRSDAYLNGVDHVRPITIGGMEQFNKRLNLKWQAAGWANTPLALYSGVDFKLVSITNVVSPAWAKKREAGMTDEELEFCANTYWNVLDEIKMVLEKVVG